MAGFAADDEFNDSEAPAPDSVTTQPANPEGEVSGNLEVEALYDKADQEQKKRNEEKAAQKKEVVPEASTLSELANLAPFEDVAVIQRKFLPRTKRFEFTGSGMTSVNNPFFNNLGLAIRGAYHITENHGLEAQYMLFSNTRRGVTDALRDKRLVQTENLVTAKSYMGLAYKYVPVYGKITFLNHIIVPFDLYFTLGGGMSQTQKQSEPTLHFGSGQSFAISKKVAFRWDIVWNFYSATVDAVRPKTGTTKSFHNDLFLSAGMSFFIPEATYR